MYRLPYEEFFGGVSGMTANQFRKINGFPNAFWGWGGEDDDLWHRYTSKLLTKQNRVLQHYDLMFSKEVDMTIWIPLNL